LDSNPACYLQFHLDETQEKEKKKTTWEERRGNEVEEMKQIKEKELISIKLGNAIQCN